MSEHVSSILTVVAAILALGSTVGSIVAVLVSTRIAARKAPAETSLLKAQAAKVDAEVDVALAESQVKQAESWMVLHTALEARVRALELELEDFRDWATRLSSQVVKLGGVPVPFKVGVKKERSIGVR